MSARTAQPMPARSRGDHDDARQGRGSRRNGLARAPRGAALAAPRRDARARGARASAAAAPSVPDDAPAAEAGQPGEALDAYSVVMKFGGSSVADAERMREVASIVLAFQEEMPCWC